MRRGGPTFPGNPSGDTRLPPARFAPVRGKVSARRRMSARRSRMNRLHLGCSAIALVLAQGTAHADFASRCADPAVIKCVGFDAAADISGTYGDRSGILSGATTPVLDSAVKASGPSSLKFTIPSNSGADTS